MFGFGVLIVVFITGVGFVMWKFAKEKKVDEKLMGTEEIIPKLLLKNQWVSVDDVVRDLEKSKVSFHFSLRD